ncbi:MAG: hypothetical protein WCO11_05325 [Sphingomonadales bacterium]|jgi:hypothetical protein
MRASDILGHFSAKVDAPVDVNDVLAFMRDGGVECDVSFIEVELDTEILLGQYQKFYVRPVPYADPEAYANIYYAKQMTRDWQRLVCCKELLHLIDRDGHKATTPDQIRKNAEHIGLPIQLRDFDAQDPIANTDTIAEFFALGILFPLAARAALMDPFKAGKLKIDDIARFFDIPKQKASFVMTPNWESVHANLMKMGL